MNNKVNENQIHFLAKLSLSKQQFYWLIFSLVSIDWTKVMLLFSVKIKKWVYQLTKNKYEIFVGKPYKNIVNIYCIRVGKAFPALT